MYASAILQTGVVESSSLLPASLPRVYSSDGTLVALLHPVALFTLALLFSALDRYLGRWYFTYQRSSPGAVDRTDDDPALFGPVVFEYPFGSPLNSRLAPPSAFALVAQSLRSCGR